jgi:hypothetical protein
MTYDDKRYGEAGRDSGSRHSRVSIPMAAVFPTFSPTRYVDRFALVKKRFFDR